MKEEMNTNRKPTTGLNQQNSAFYKPCMIGNSHYSSYKQNFCECWPWIKNTELYVYWVVVTSWRKHVFVTKLPS